jgi:hypothetical protein
MGWNIPMASRNPLETPNQPVDEQKVLGGICPLTKVVTNVTS